MKSGAKGGKILGSGGGGFILLYCEPENQNLIRKELTDINKDFIPKMTVEDLLVCPMKPHSVFGVLR